jgi:hypothetical protein
VHSRQATGNLFGGDSARPPYAQFPRALTSGNAHLALAAGAELRAIGLADALGLLLLTREDKPVL